MDLRRGGNWSTLLRYFSASFFRPSRKGAAGRKDREILTRLVLRVCYAESWRCDWCEVFFPPPLSLAFFLVLLFSIVWAGGFCVLCVYVQLLGVCLTGIYYPSKSIIPTLP